MAEFVDIVLVLLLGGTLGWLSQKMKFPNAAAQVLLGVLLGTAVLGWVPHTAILHMLGEIGIVLLLGVAGLRLGIERLKSAGGAGVAVATPGILISVVGGYAIGSWYGLPGEEALYIGIALGATSIGITVDVLRQFGLIGHRVADIIVAAAVIDDVIVLYLLAATHGVLSDGLSASGVLKFVVLAIVVLGGLYVVCRGLGRWASRRSLLDKFWQRGVCILSVIALGALSTYALDLSSVVGAFFAGVGVGDGIGPEAREESASELVPLVLILMPFFFVMIGVQAQWNIFAEPGLLWLVLVLIIFAILSKVIGGVLGAMQLDQWRERWIIGFGMAARGEVALVTATLAFEQGHLTHPVFVAIVFTTIALSILGPSLMAPFAMRLASASLPGAAR